MEMGTGKVVIVTDHRKFVLSYIATKIKEEAYNRTPLPPKSRMCPQMEGVPSVPLSGTDIPSEISGNACARLFNFMKSHRQPCVSKIEQTYLCHTTVSGNVIYDYVPGKGEQIKEILPAIRVESPLSISAANEKLLQTYW
jgi:hypothetical protein